MTWIQVKNKMFLKDEVIGLEFKPTTEKESSSLLVHLRSSQFIRIHDREAEDVWMHFKDEIKESTEEIGTETVRFS